MHPASPHPCTLFCPRSGEMPAPRKPSWPATSDRFKSEWALWMPLTCWVIPMPHTRQEPLNGRRAYRRVPGRRVRDVLRGHAEDSRRAVQRDLGQGRTPLLEAFRPRPDQFPVGQALVEDDARHRVEQRHVRPRLVLDPEIRLIAQLDAL